MRLLLDGVGQAAEDLVEVTADFPGLDERAEQLGERLWMLGTGNRQRGAVFEVETDFTEDPCERRVLDLGREDPQRPDHRKTGVDHGGELAGHHGNLA